MRPIASRKVGAAFPALGALLAIASSNCAKSGTAITAGENSHVAVVEVTTRFHRFGECLLGAPLEGLASLAGEKRASHRLHGVDMAISTGALDETAPWPNRCTTALASLLAGLDALESLSTAESAQATERLSRLHAAAKSLIASELPPAPPDYFAEVDGETRIDALWEGARDGGLFEGPETKSDPSLPQALKMPSAPLVSTRAAKDAPATRTLRALGGFDGLPSSDLAPDEAIRVAFFDLACRFAPGKAGALSTARCKSIVGESTPRRPLSTAAEVDALVLAETKPSLRVREAEIETVLARDFSERAFMRDYGSLLEVMASDGGRSAKLVRRTPDGKLATRAIGVRASEESWYFVRDSVFWIGRPKAKQAPLVPLTVQRIEPGSNKLGPRVALGTIEVGLRPRACRAKDSIAIVARGPAPAIEGEKTVVRMVLFTGSPTEGVWHAPVAWNGMAGGVGGGVGSGVDADHGVDLGLGFAPIVDAWDDLDRLGHGKLTCRAGEATLTWIEGAGSTVVHSLRCTPEGCTEKVSAALERPFGEGELTARVVDLDGRVLLLRESRGTALLGTKFRAVAIRIAPIEQLATAPDRMLLLEELPASTAATAGAAKTSGVWLYGAEGAAVALIGLDGVLYAVRIAADGSVGELEAP